MKSLEIKFLDSLANAQITHFAIGAPALPWYKRLWYRITGRPVSPAGLLYSGALGPVYVAIHTEDPNTGAAAEASYSNYTRVSLTRSDLHD